jgi:predicted DNA-binding transcriptional regulator YafY
MNRTDRLLAIVLELQRKGHRRAEDLAAFFETSKRTIYRDIQALCESGVPVVAQPGSGYSLVEGYFLPPVTFSTDEATMLLLGSEFVAGNFDAQYREAAHSASRKIEAVLSQKLRAEVDYLRSSIAFVPAPVLSGSAAANFLPQLRRAIIEQRTIKFHYHTRYSDDGSSVQRTREANPYGLVHYGESWYFIGHCHLRNDIRNFKINRISDLRILERKFERPANFRMEPPEDESRQIVVRALFDSDVAPWVREMRSFFVTNMEELPDCLLVSLKVRVINEILPWLLSWGGHVRILEPESVRRRLMEEAQKMLEKNSRNE